MCSARSMVPSRRAPRVTRCDCGALQAYTRRFSVREFGCRCAMASVPIQAGILLGISHSKGPVWPPAVPANRIVRRRGAKPSPRCPRNRRHCGCRPGRTGVHCGDNVEPPKRHQYRERGLYQSDNTNIRSSASMPGLETGLETSRPGRWMTCLEPGFNCLLRAADCVEYAQVVVR